MPTLLHLTGRHRPYASAQAALAHLEQRALHPVPFGPPPRLRPKVDITLEHRSGWPIYTLTPLGSAPELTVIYLHGGGWVNEITSAHWQLAAQIAHQAGATVVVPIYPLLPTATAADVLPEIVDMAAQHADVCLAGDSAGGQMALSAALMLRDDHGMAIPATVLISPALDLSLGNPDIASVEPTDPWLGRDALHVYAERWRGDLPVDDPRVSPLAADLTGLGPLTVFSGTRDILNPDARLLAEKAAAAGVDIEYYEQPGLIHVYPLTPTPEGRAACRIIVERIGGTTGSTRR
ncbi:alpha/beta hydrolase [Mycobacterium sp. TY815]|uniref:alpha/beta hydrolase n=1 Tax=Mycobacterium sp. TY815 TaxID=3050581 RepID=UPI0027410BEF|nr:alpha/beta hydrolase [Mycobacterium sp. TY815]MDP7701667.1 alpha/beta hydrolase [Mycobacterium sp. TY815]